MKDLTSQRFGRWTVVQFSHRTKYRDSYWLCRCDCGNENTVRSYHLIHRKSQSCGCLQRELAALAKYKHGLSYHPMRSAYTQMKQRCYNPNSDSYPRYGGRGIIVCNRWKRSFANFLADMGERPKNTTLDRIDNNGPYSPENCRWATEDQQHANRCNSRFLEHDGLKLTVAQWAQRLGLHPNTIRSRLRYGWSVHDILTRPIDTRCRHPS